MSNYTEAHFAATLLSCGPHVNRWQMYTPPANDYLNRVYAYFFVLFPSKLEYFDTKNVKHEWFMFWRDYVRWVES
ncbi:hypothetical protein LCGC14_1451530 [marine sediment metagenome]|uniref:Uncharacterized protein n=1 Tax=marine sediment metagenome TaxID=412755 RepID=A0A0F9K426_9ZZZZ